MKVLKDDLCKHQVDYSTYMVMKKKKKTNINAAEESQNKLMNSTLKMKEKKATEWSSYTSNVFYEKIIQN